MNDTPAYINSTDHVLFGSITDALKDIYDPEIPINIYDLGLIYGVKIEGRKDAARVTIKMTLTSPACPVAGEMPHWVAQAAASVEGVEHAHVDLVWEPPWGVEQMSEEAQLEFGLT